MAKTIDLTLHVWRQKNAEDAGRFVDYQAKGVSTEMSFLEMLDVVNEDLIHKGRDPIAFDHDCREGICGMCGLVINGRPHGARARTTTCQLHMRSFKDGDTITIEPCAGRAFPVIKDLVVDRAAFDRIIQAGGFISVHTGWPPEANATRVPKQNADLAMDAAACIGCGACVAACPNACAMLFVAPRSPTWRCCPRASRSATPGPWPWSSRWTPRASATAPTTASAKRPAPRASPWRTSPA